MFVFSCSHGDLLLNIHRAVIWQKVGLKLGRVCGSACDGVKMRGIKGFLSSNYVWVLRFVWTPVSQLKCVLNAVTVKRIESCKPVTETQHCKRRETYTSTFSQVHIQNHVVLTCIYFCSDSYLRGVEWGGVWLLKRSVNPSLICVNVPPINAAQSRFYWGWCKLYRSNTVHWVCTLPESHLSTRI